MILIKKNVDAVNEEFKMTDTVNSIHVVFQEEDNLTLEDICMKKEE